MTASFSLPRKFGWNKDDTSIEMASIPSLGPHVTKDDTTPLSVEEAELYYYGLRSHPRLIARTGSIPWEPPTGPEAYPKIKELRVVGNHEIKHIWEDNVALKVHAILNKNNVDWTSTDVVRFGYAKEHSGGVILWIGVRPQSLSYEVGIDVAFQCKRLLSDHGITDVDVEIRDSVVTQLAGPKLLKPGFDSEPTVDVRKPFTPTLGLKICAQPTPWAEGTSGIYLEEGGEGTRLLLVTSRHVILPQSKNNPFEHRLDTQPRYNILILSKASFQQYLVSIQRLIDDEGIGICYHMSRIKKMEGREDAMAIKECEGARRDLERANKKVQALKNFKCELSTQWAADEDRILGHLIYSPPIVVGAGTDNYTQDIAVIAIDASKIDPSCFACNVIDLGFKYNPAVLTAMMHPHIKNSHKFSFPDDRLLKLHGIITAEEMRNPTMYDQDNEPCIMVLKHGATTGLTVGCANNIMSYTCYNDKVSRVSKEWAILPFDKKNTPFSERGDSGSIVVDGSGRIGGILTAGNGTTDDIDMAYVTPFEFVMDAIHNYKHLANTYLKQASG